MSATRPTTMSWMPSSSTTNIVRGVALRVVGVDVAREQVDERGERVAQLVVVQLGQPPVLAHEHARVADALRAA